MVESHDNRKASIYLSLRTACLAGKPGQAGGVFIKKRKALFEAIIVAECFKRKTPAKG